LICDPNVDAERISATSPTPNVDRIKIPILLIHGDADDIVPYEQSQQLKKRLDGSWRKTELVALEDEGRSYWSPEQKRRTLGPSDGFPGNTWAPESTSRRRAPHEPMDGA
jgi:dipeptidyl aminopeptidase/acylaminoacyl peptidase